MTDRGKANSLTSQRCPQCAVVLTAKVLSGLCPNCLLKNGGQDIPTPAVQSFQPPSLELLTEVMRGIFEPTEFLGRGGMGAVYKGRHEILNRIVALKVMPPRPSDDDNLHRFHRFKRESRLLARLNHENVIAAYDFGVAGNLLYFAMDFVDGCTLRVMLDDGPLNPSYSLKLFGQLCDGLHHAHQRGVIHRDIKPENLLVDKNGVLKIADFGLAKLNGGNVSREWRTAEPCRMGTPHYMAPEQIEKPSAVDHRADIYSAGVVLYEMLTGELPLGRFSPPSEKAKVASSLDEVLLRALANDCARRHQTIREFKAAVETGFLEKTARARGMTESVLPARHRSASSGQLAQWAERVTGRFLSGRDQRGQLTHWGELVAARAKRTYVATA